MQWICQHSLVTSCCRNMSDYFLFYCRGPPPPPGMIRPGMHPPFPPRGPDPFMHGPRPGMGPGPGPGMDHGPGFGPRPRFQLGPNGPLPGPMPGPPEGPFLPPSMIVCRSALLSPVVSLRQLVTCFCYTGKPLYNGHPEAELTGCCGVLAIVGRFE